MSQENIPRKIAKARELLGSRAFSLHELAAQTGLSSTYLQKQFKLHYGLSPAEFSAQQKLIKLKKNLRQSDDVMQAWVDSGFGSSSRIYENGAAKLGMLPVAYKKGGAGLIIHWTYCETLLGATLVAATERGICAVILGDNQQRLLAELHAEFPNADLNFVEDNHQVIAEKVQHVARMLSGKASTASIELLGTVFQHKVWQALMKIPAGQTLSYAELAETISLPNAARAVARACASNKIAVLVPCHRIIRADGSLGGYRWGLPLKKKILQQESVR